MIGKSARYHRHSCLRPRARQRPKSAFRQLIIQQSGGVIYQVLDPSRGHSYDHRNKGMRWARQAADAEPRRVPLLAASVLIGALYQWFRSGSCAQSHGARSRPNPLCAENRILQMVVPHRPAVLMAKILATIDVMSGGRLIVGVGAGWLEEEFVAIGAPPFAERGTATDEYLMAFRELWTKDKPRFDGRFVKFSDILFAPK